MILKRPARDVLMQMYHTQHMTQEAIADSLGVDRYTVREWMKLYGIKARVTNQVDIAEMTLRDLYEIQGKTQKEIARILQVSVRSIRRRIQDFHIVPRPRSGKDNGNYKHGKNAGIHAYRHAKPIEACERCRGTQNLCVHHTDFDHYNNHPDNLQILCVSCHSSVHKQAYWDAIKQGATPPKSNAPIGWYRSKPPNDSLGISHDVMLGSMPAGPAPQAAATEEP